MFSKIFHFTLALILLSSCDKFLRSSQTESERSSKKQIEVKVGGLECLNELSEQLKKYTEDNSSEYEIAASFACVDKAIDSFFSLTKPRIKDQYSQEDLTYFLNRYVITGQKIQPELVREAMKFKVLMLGGSDQYLQRAEVPSIHSFLGLLKTEVQNLRGLMGILLFKKSKESYNEVSDSDLDLAQNKLLTSVQKLVTNLQIEGSKYELHDFNQLVREIKVFIGENAALDSISKWMPIILSLKNLLIGQDANISSNHDWREAINYGFKIYSLALQAVYRLQHVEFKKSQDWLHILNFTDQVVQLLELSPQMQRHGQLLAKDLDITLDELWKLNLIHTKIPLTTIKDAYRRFIIRVLDRNLDPLVQNSEVSGIYQKHLAILRMEYNVWRLSQISLFRCFPEAVFNSGMSSADLATCLKQFDVDSEIAKLKDSNLHTAELHRSWSAFLDLMTEEPTMMWTSNLKVLLAEKYLEPKTNLMGLSVENAFRSVSRFILRAYGEAAYSALREQDVEKLLLTERNLVLFSEDFYDLGIAIRFLDPRSKNPAARTFKEANFFTLHGDGDSWLTHQELIEELSLLFSGGAVMTSEFMQNAIEAGCSTHEKDILDRDILNEECAYKSFVKNFANITEGMPGLVQRFSNKGLVEDKKSFMALFKSLLAIARIPERKPETLEYAEIRTALTVLQYVESLFVIYDKNQDQQLSQDEVLMALPRFKSFIIKASPEAADYLEDVFLFLAYKGRKPTGVSDILMIKFEKTIGLGHINRLELLKVLAELKKDVESDSP